MSDTESEEGSIYDSGSDGEMETEIDSSDEDDDPVVPVERLPLFRIQPPEIEDDEEEPFRENFGPRNMPVRTSSPATYFFLFMTLDFIRRLVTETDRCVKIGF